MTTQETEREDGLRELNVWIAERLFGFKWVQIYGDPRTPHIIFMPPEQAAKYLPESILDRPANYLECYARDLPNFAEDMNAAMLVVEAIVSRNDDTIVSWTRNSKDSQQMGGEARYFCTVEDVSDGIQEWEASAEGPAEAICLAALEVLK
jgi:hypothetical protein